MKTAILTIPNTFFWLTDRRRLIPLVALVLVLMASYVYLFQTSVLYLKERETALENINIFETDIAILETELLARRDQIDLALALNLGFVELTAEPIFARRNAATRLSLLVGDEI
jgi:hypothetical protein